MHLCLFFSCDITIFAIAHLTILLGHGSVIQASDGVYWYFYHSWRYKELNKNQPGRVLLLDKINWDILPEAKLKYNISTMSNKMQVCYWVSHLYIHNMK